MQGEMEGSGRSFKFILWLGSNGTSGDLEPTQADALLIEKDFVLSPLPEVERFQNLINMKQWQCGIFQICDAKGEPIADPKTYALFFNNITTVYNWFMTGEHNKDGIFHVHALMRTAQRTDALRRTITTAWDNLMISENFRAVVGQQATIDCLKLQRCHKPSSLAGYMMKSPEWVLGSDEKMLQLGYDIDLWNLNDRFKPKEDEPDTSPEMNQMTKELIELIVSNGCKTIEDCMRHGPQILSKYLHKPGIGAIVENCIKFVRASGATWSLNIFEVYEPNPEPIHKILLHQGIRPWDFDLTMFTWLTKTSGKQNTLVLWGPSNTGKSAFISGLKQVVPWGEITNGSSGFNFEGLIDQVIGIWEEPLINPETAEKCKQVFEGMTCSIPVKYKKPYMLPRIPILITTNHAPWRWCQAEEEMFRNRMYIFPWQYQCKNETFCYRAIEHGCKCRYCQGSRCSEIAIGTTELGGLQGSYESLLTEQQPVGADKSTDVGSGSLSGRDGGDEGCSGTAGGSNSSSKGVNSSNTGGQSSSGGSGAERHMGEFRIIRPNTNERRNTGGAKQHVESNESGERAGSNSGRNGSRRGRGRGIQSDGGGRAEKHNSVTTLGPWLVNKKAKVETTSETKKQRVDRVLESQIESLTEDMSVPSAGQWKQYLSYLFHWHG